MSVAHSLYPTFRNVPFPLRFSTLSAPLRPRQRSMPAQCNRLDAVVHYHHRFPATIPPHKPPSVWTMAAAPYTPPPCYPSPSIPPRQKPPTTKAKPSPDDRLYPYATHPLHSVGHSAGRPVQASAGQTVLAIGSVPCAVSPARWGARH